MYVIVRGMSLGSYYRIDRFHPKSIWSYENLSMRPRLISRVRRSPSPLANETPVDAINKTPRLCIACHKTLQRRRVVKRWHLFQKLC
jgi:hypothetical protein